MGPLVDARVEAVAGAPVLDVTAPFFTEAWQGSGTAVFVGVENPPIARARAIQNWEPTYTDTAYADVYHNNRWAVIGDGRLLSPPRTGLVACWAPIKAGTLGLGRGRLTTQNWTVPFRALAYAQVLTEAQAAEVARRLATTL